MKVFYSQEDLSDAQGGIFLAGPTGIQTWRPQAFDILKEQQFHQCIYIPEDRDAPGHCTNSGTPAQINWCLTAMRRCDVVAFWIPRDIQNLPGFHTNIEFGACSGLDKETAVKPYVLGYPPDAPKMTYLVQRANDQSRPICSTLRETMLTAIQLVNLET